MKLTRRGAAGESALYKSQTYSQICKKLGRDGMRTVLWDSCISPKSRGRCYSSMLTLVVIFKMVEDLFTSRDFSLFTQFWNRVESRRLTCESIAGQPCSKTPVKATCACLAVSKCPSVRSSAGCCLPARAPNLRKIPQSIWDTHLHSRQNCNLKNV